MKQMKIARQIRIQRLQSKNRMVGQTFNPSGITSQQIDDREKAFVALWRPKTREERIQYWSNVQKILDRLEEANLSGSWDWTWCAFKRAFILNGEVY